MTVAGNALASSVGAVHRSYRPPRRHLLLAPVMAKPMNDVEREELRRVAGRLTEVRIEQARRDPNAFVEYCFTDDEGRALKQAWFHEQMHSLMSAQGRVAIALPRDHGKSSQIVARTIWELGRNPNLRVKIVAETDQRARDRLYQIALMVTGNKRVREVFPNLIPDQEGQWTKGRFYVQRSSQERDPSVEASGVLSSATGGRCDILIGDDVVGRKTSLTQPGMRDEVKRAWHSDWENVVKPDGRTWYVFTPWHHDDLSADILKNRLYHKLVIPIEEPFGAIWPERYSEAVLRERYELIGPIEYARAFWLKASHQSDQIVQEEWIRWVDASGMTELDYDLLLSYDLASAENKKADYTASVLLGVAKNERRLVVFDAWHDRLAFPRLVRRIEQEAQAYHAEVLSEAVQFQRALALALKERNSTLPVKQCFPRASKAERLRVITPYMVNGVLQFSEALRNPRPERGDLIGEMLDFGVTAHDDMVDALTQAVIYVAERDFGVASPSSQQGSRLITFGDTAADLPEGETWFDRFVKANEKL